MSYIKVVTEWGDWMSRARNFGYAALCAGLIGAGALAGNARERYANTLPAEQRAGTAEQRISELQRELGRYSVRLSDGREVRLNPDMSVTISGVSGERTVSMQAGEYRAVRAVGR